MQSDASLCKTPSEASENEKSTPELVPAYSRRVSRLSWYTIIISLLFAPFLFALDNVIVADIQPRLIEDIGEVDKLPWVSVGYALGAASLTLSGSKLFASFDHKYVFISGVLIFEIGSAICGSAQNMTALIFGRVICGPGAVGLYVGMNNLICDMTTESERPLYMGLVGICWGLGTILGPVIGGAFTDGSATWRWSFYINLCVGGAIIPIYLFMLPSYSPRPEVPFRTRVAQIDWVGTILHAAAYATVVMAISFGGSIYAWSSGSTIALFVCSAVLWTLFVIQQHFSIMTTIKDRIVPFEVVTDWEMQVLFAAIASASAICFIPVFFIPIFFQFVEDTDALGAAVHLVPFAVLNVVGTVSNGAIMAKFGYYMPWYLVGGILSTTGGSLFCSLLTVNTSSAALHGYSVLCGFGSGLFIMAGMAVAQAKVTPDAIPHALAFMGCGQITGIVLALSISNSVFLNLATDKLSQIIPGATKVHIQQAIQGVDSSLLRALDEQTRAEALDAIVWSIRHVYAMVIAAGVLTIALSLTMKREKLFGDQGFDTRQSSIETSESVDKETCGK